MAKVLGAAVVVGLTVFRMAPVTGSALPASTSSTEDIAQVERSVYYPGCRAARAAGVAPIHRGSPGYRPEMDGDDDGIACEPHRTE
ncbi:excalibur calcium-binding domain-containing protein [Sphingomonas sp. BT553]|uniref:Excalibur calcium-binding domain-containing protein n=2 Tax=Sphingomonas mollis TaxID=2795726 RepID=A0ABS0XJT0_9SPHN|nr:excalibur calcium-binding domain-containing protein [Sphingomonas sp. BT553]